MRTTSKRKRQLLLELAREKKTVHQVNQILESDTALGSVTHLEWELWRNFYEPLVQRDSMLEKEIIDEERSLSWLARRANEKTHKTPLS